MQNNATGCDTETCHPVTPAIVWEISLDLHSVAQLHPKKASPKASFHIFYVLSARHFEPYSMSFWRLNCRTLGLTSELFGKWSAYFASTMRARVLWLQKSSYFSTSMFRSRMAAVTSVLRTLDSWSITRYYAGSTGALNSILALRMRMCDYLVRHYCLNN